METFLEFLREVLKGIVREISAYFFRKNILENKKTTLRRRKQELMVTVTPRSLSKIDRELD